MKVYNLLDILPYYKSPIKATALPQKANTDLHSSNESQMPAAEQTEDNINNFLDNDDIEFVTRNIENGKAAEEYVKNLMLKKYGNCNKVEAKEGYDFNVVSQKQELRIEVKSIQSHNSPFHITINEITNAQKYSDGYYLCFVILPSLQIGVKEVRFLHNPIKNLGIIIREQKYEGMDNKCIIMPEKFLIKPRSGFIRNLGMDI